MCPEAAKFNIAKQHEIADNQFSLRMHASLCVESYCPRNSARISPENNLRDL